MIIGDRQYEQINKTFESMIKELRNIRERLNTQEEENKLLKERIDVFKNEKQTIEENVIENSKTLKKQNVVLDQILIEVKDHTRMLNE